MKKNILKITLLLIAQIHTMEPPALETESWETRSQQGTYSPAVCIPFITQGFQDDNAEPRNTMSPPIPIPLRPYYHRRAHLPNTQIPSNHTDQSTGHLYPNLEIEASSPAHQRRSYLPSAPPPTHIINHRHSTQQLNQSTTEPSSWLPKQELARSASPTISQSSSLPQYTRSAPSHIPIINTANKKFASFLEMQKQLSTIIQTRIEREKLKIEEAHTTPLSTESPKMHRRNSMFNKSAKQSGWDKVEEERHQQIRAVSTGMYSLIDQIEEYQNSDVVQCLLEERSRTQSQ
jgi:hypothetical protein